MTQYFTLFSRPASTKKRGLTLAFGARAGRSAARNRAKRQAREAYRLHRSRLPEAKEVVITSRGNLGDLSRRAMREQLAELFGRAVRSSPQPQGARTTTTRTGRP